MRMPAPSSVILGRQVIMRKAEALTRLADELDDSFANCVKLLLEIEGRVAVTGLGKSGLIGRKIAATLSSTGTPSYFIHPVEASHGDLGMLDVRDALLVISRSGDTAELADILRYVSRYGMPIIAVTRNPQSYLGRRAAICLRLPDAEEACPLACAPTTSTTLSLALGDALAIALLKARGFTPEDMRNFHPGGVIGKKLMTVKEIMHTGESLPLVDLDDPMDKVLLVMTGKGFGCAAVLDAHGKLTGLITDGDLRRYMDSSLMRRSASEIMTPSPYTVSRDCRIGDAIKLMNERKITALLIAEDEKPIGLVHMHDCLRSAR